MSSILGGGTHTFGVTPDEPGIGSVAITQADADLTPPYIRSLVVFAAGDVKFTGINGNVDTWTIPAAACPYTIPVAMKRVWDTGTTVADANLRGIV